MNTQLITLRKNMPWRNHNRHEIIIEHIIRSVRNIDHIFKSDLIFHLDTSCSIFIRDEYHRKANN
jgi:hypothetical protein